MWLYVALRLYDALNLSALWASTIEGEMPMSLLLYGALCSTMYASGVFHMQRLCPNFMLEFLLGFCLKEFDP